jgi:hypothetical protein
MVAGRGAVIRSYLPERLPSFSIGRPYAGSPDTSGRLTPVPPGGKPRSDEQRKRRPELVVAHPIVVVLTRLIDRPKQTHPKTTRWVF